MPSVIDAAMNSAEASSSFSPFALGKRLVDRIQIRAGMLKMRVSVMELGRFTADSSRGRPEPETSDARLSPTKQLESNGRTDQNGQCDEISRSAAQVTGGNPAGAPPLLDLSWATCKRSSHRYIPLLS